ncbi:MAG: UDP-N-acetylglucosamine 2-epimerase (non-hydrolyzing) [Opitutae bacterium]|jgi:UDP-GlcNAc3NAcA epimerase|nr:UDP-N-acetylglucosamine 2-epimerase (non-hydrolyzing) [Opitutae bacterium]MBT6851567.1 UDP-N-acetylglucosamine 2-epimerase (non-hydrolyzing) [Opitutae bacterium]
MKVVSVIGARPQFVKAAVVSRALREGQGAEEFLLHTGQHFDDNMSRVFFEEMGIPEPDANLAISGGGHGAMTGAMLTEIENVLQGERPDWALVYGDTNSTLAGALAAAKLNLPCAHVEAGLRSDNRNMPEEINRILTDHACDLLFAPTDEAARRLAAEGIAGDRVIRTGDVMLDAARTFGDLAREKSKILEVLGLGSGGFALCTLHRAENVDDRDCLAAILRGLGEVSESLPIILPLHPRTNGRLTEFGLRETVPPTIRFVDPVGFLDMLRLEAEAALILTDSGGMQKEAFFQRTPCVTIRTETEWTELLPGGHNRLACPGVDSISEKAQEALHSDPAWDLPLYGDGHSSETIAQAIIDHR